MEIAIIVVATPETAPSLEHVTEGVGTVMDHIQGLMPGRVVGAEGRTAERCQQTVRMEIDTEALQAEMDKVPDPVPMLFGARLFTDDPVLAELLTESSSSGDTSQRLGDQYPSLVPLARTAIQALEKQNVPLAEIFVMRGDVRAMTTVDFGRKDSGWFSAGQIL